MPIEIKIFKAEFGRLALPLLPDQPAADTFEGHPAPAWRDQLAFFVIIQNPPRQQRSVGKETDANDGSNIVPLVHSVREPPYTSGQHN